MKTGRPKKEEDRDKLVPVGFKADGKTRTAIDVLVQAERKRGSVAPKSAAIRRALQDAASRVLAGKEEK